MSALAELADAGKRTVWIEDLPGSFVHPALPLLFIDGPKPDEAFVDDLRDVFTIHASRDIGQDPRFGLIVLSEIASRALSPAVNDPGTAIDVIGRVVRLLSAWAPDHDAAPDFPCLHVPAIDPADLLDDALSAIARDGAAFIEVQARLQHALTILASLKPDAFSAAARRLATEAETRALAAFTLPHDGERLRRAMAAGKGMEPR